MEGDQEQSGKNDAPDVPLQSGKVEEVQQVGKGINNSLVEEKLEPLQEEEVVEDKVRHLLVFSILQFNVLFNNRNIYIMQNTMVWWWQLEKKFN